MDIDGCLDPLVSLQLVFPSFDSLKVLPSFPFLNKSRKYTESNSTVHFMGVFSEHTKRSYFMIGEKQHRGGFSCQLSS